MRSLALSTQFCSAQSEHLSTAQRKLTAVGAPRQDVARGS